MQMSKLRISSSRLAVLEILLSLAGPGVGPVCSSVDHPSLCPYTIPAPLKAGYSAANVRKGNISKDLYVA
jgi:hypothetical protein